MTKEEALYQFFNRVPRLTRYENGELGVAPDADCIPAYASTSVPDDAQLPYITYTVLTAAFGEPSCSLTVNIWCRTTSEAEPNAYAREMGKIVPRGGTLVACDDGGIWIRRGSPWCISYNDDTDSNIKRRYFNVTAEYLTGG